MQLPSAKTAKSCAFCDSLPVFALECFSANETGVLGLWLGAFGKSGLFMCQSVPGPLSLFCDTELHFLGVVCRLSPWYVFSFKNRLSVSETGLAGFGGFGSGLLVRQGF